MDNELKCICYWDGIENPPIWSETPDPLGCPVHGPQLKLYCRIHHSGFYGSCQACRYDEQLEMQNEIRLGINRVVTALGRLLKQS